MDALNLQYSLNRPTTQFSKLDEQDRCVAKYGIMVMKILAIVGLVAAIAGAFFALLNVRLLELAGLVFGGLFCYDLWTVIANGEKSIESGGDFTDEDVTKGTIILRYLPKKWRE